MNDVAAAAAGSCSNANCNVQKDRQCAEGRNLDDCPYFLKSGAALTSAESVEIDTDEPDDHIELSHADRLSMHEALPVLAEFESRFVSIVGESDAGKTSIISGMYELFQLERVNGIELARSHTLHAFEKACHHTRTNSNRDEAASERTESGIFKLFHLCVCAPKETRKLNLLLADRWGEDYREALNGNFDATELGEISRSDLINLLIDGGKLVDASQRHGVRHNAEMTVQLLFESQLTRTSQKLAVVLTKLDEVNRSGDRERILRDFESTFNRIALHHKFNFAKIASFKVAASPKNLGTKRGEGMSELLEFWMSSLAATDTFITRNYENIRMIDLLREDA